MTAVILRGERNTSDQMDPRVEGHANGGLWNWLGSGEGQGDELLQGPSQRRGQAET